MTMFKMQNDSASGQHRKQRYSSSARLKFWTNFGLVTAVVIGMLVVVAHGGHQTSGIAWGGAGLALGGLLGFLFGIPGRSQSSVQINQPLQATVVADSGKVTGTGAGDEVAHPLTSEGGEPGEPKSPPTGTPSPDSPAPGPGNTSGALVPPTVHPTSQTNPDAPSEPSNLEQVSDWVTKLLLGGGLTQLQQIPKMVWELAYSVAVGINPDATGQYLWSEQAFAAALLVYFFITGFFGGYLITKLQLGRSLR
jgi:hypothetical protein